MLSPALHSHIMCALLVQSIVVRSIHVAFIRRHIERVTSYKQENSFLSAKPLNHDPALWPAGRKF